MNEPNKSRDLLSAWEVHPIETNTTVVITNEAIVIPDTGRLEVPIVPVNLPATITNNRDSINDKIAPTIVIIMLSDIINEAISPITVPANNIIK